MQETVPTAAPPTLLDGWVVHERPEEELAAPEARAVAQARLVLELHVPDPGPEPTLEAFNVFAERQLAPTVLLMRASLDALLESLGPLEAGDASARRMALLLSVAANAHAASEVLGVPTPIEVRDDAELRRVFRAALAESVRSVAQRAVAAAERCKREASSYPPAFQPWRARCAEVARELRDHATAPPRPARAERRPSQAEAPDFPADCAGAPRPMGRESPLPDESRPRRLVVLLEDGVPEAARGPLRQALRRALPRRPGVPRAAPAAYLDTAERLVSERRWSDDAPICQQAPPLHAVLAERVPNPVVAAVSGRCEEGAPTCSLRVWFRHGTLMSRAMPAPLAATVAEPDNPDAWLDAVASLEPLERRTGVVGTLRGGAGGAKMRFLEETEAAPVLRVRLRLADHLDALAACLPPGTAASVAVAWDIDTDGATLRPRVQAGSLPSGADAAALEACVRDVLDQVGWRCPRNGRPEPVAGRLCIARPAAS